MTRQQAQKLARKDTLTANQRRQLLRYIYKLAGDLSYFTYALADACDNASNEIRDYYEDDGNEDREMPDDAEERMDALEDACEKLQTASQAIDDMDLPMGSDVQ